MARFFTSLFSVMALLLSMASTAGAVSITLQAGRHFLIKNETVSVTVEVNDSTGVAGATFTLEYPDSLELMNDSVATDFFQIFSDATQGADPASIYPWAKNVANNGKILLSGAYINSANGGAMYTGKKTLFSMNFKVKETATLGAATLTLLETELWNPDAGWGTDVDGDKIFDEGVDAPEEAPVLIGAVNNSDAAWSTTTLNDDFPVLIQAFSAHPTLAFTISADADLDQMPDDWEGSNGLNAGSDDAGGDLDGDGFSNLEEFMNGTDPQLLTSPGLRYLLQPGWNAVALLLEPTPSFDSRTLAEEMNLNNAQKIIKIQRWDNDSAIWETYNAGAPFGIFNIKMGEGYLVLAAEETEWVNDGTVVSCGEVSYPSVNGLNLFGFPTGGGMKAQELLDRIVAKTGDANTAARIQAWDGSGWQTFTKNASFGEFTIDRAKVYFLILNQQNGFNICQPN